MRLRDLVIKVLVMMVSYTAEAGLRAQAAIIHTWEITLLRKYVPGDDLETFKGLIKVFYLFNAVRYRSRLALGWLEPLLLIRNLIGSVHCILENI